MQKNRITRWPRSLAALRPRNQSWFKSKSFNCFHRHTFSNSTEQLIDVTNCTKCSITKYCACMSFESSMSKDFSIINLLLLTFLFLSMIKSVQCRGWLNCYELELAHAYIWTVLLKTKSKCWDCIKIGTYHISLGLTIVLYIMSPPAPLMSPPPLCLSPAVTIMIIRQIPTNTEWKPWLCFKSSEEQIISASVLPEGKLLFVWSHSTPGS